MTGVEEAAPGQKKSLGADAFTASDAWEISIAGFFVREILLQNILHN